MEGRTVSRKHKRASDELERPRIDVWCTCGGTRKPHRIGYLIDYRTRPVRLTREGIEGHDRVIPAMGGEPGKAPEPFERGGFAYYAGDSVPSAKRPDGGQTFTFFCSDCRRRPQRREETLGVTVDEWRESGAALFDVSALD